MTPFDKFISNGFLHAATPSRKFERSDSRAYARLQSMKKVHRFRRTPRFDGILAITDSVMPAWIAGIQSRGMRLETSM
jgi:hypothetical protein